MEPITTIGTEHEYELVDKQGYLANIAPTFYEAPENLAGEFKGSFEKEGTDAQIEVHGAPEGTGTIRELHGDLVPRLELAHQIAEREGAYIVPGSEYGAGEGELNKAITRFEGYRAIIGEKGSDKILRISGTHKHLSQVPGYLREQFLLMSTLDPLMIGLTSTSPISYTGKNGAYCHRVKLVRDDVFSDPKLGGQLVYPTSAEDIAQLGKATFHAWQEASQIAEDRFREMGFSENNTGYNPLRVKSDLGTLEGRGADTGPVDTILPAAAVLKGVVDRAAKYRTPVTIAKKEGEYAFSDENIVVPSLSTLQDMERTTVRQGPRVDPFTRDFNLAAVQFALGGLPAQDKPYARIAHELLTGEKALVASEMMRHLHEMKGENRTKSYNGKKATSEQAASLNIFLAQRHNQGIQNLEHLL